ncbi:metal-dependent hydrolase [Brevibacillus parabrevis]|uniref:MBL fold metallo-hydrolase n=1 Tax=Brevibacillus parabrevis TaxID=54914 RepID=UPI0007ABEA10|nr:MBL fold metallo-hydrolase [Brevibacillus parabrevis]KZE50394.1 metal-dependent hydrolase [Brevibacillus parabrevis]
MNGMHLLSLSFEQNGHSQVITPVLLRDEHELILVDCGYPGFLPLLEEAANSQQLDLSALTRVIATHHDVDHIGSLAALKQAYPQIEIIAYASDAPYVTGAKTSLRILQAQATLSSLTGEELERAEQFIRFLQTIEPAPVDRTVIDQERLPWCGGIEIVHTPGHMPGHMSLYLPASQTMIAGDAVVIEDEKLAIANPQYASDLADAVRSIRRLLDYEIRQLVCYHGGLFLGDAKRALSELLQSYQAV